VEAVGFFREGEFFQREFFFWSPERGCFFFCIGTRSRAPRAILCPQANVGTRVARKKKGSFVSWIYGTTASDRFAPKAPSAEKVRALHMSA
jgi:hypothetical protein